MKVCTFMNLVTVECKCKYL